MYKKLLSLLFCLAMFLSGKAGVVVTDLSPDSTKTFAASTSGTSWFGIDFNTDGTEEYNFSWSIGRWGGGFVSLHGPAGNSIAVTGTTSSSGAEMIEVIDSGITVDSAMTWASAVIPASTPAPVIGDGEPDDFTNKGDKYIGVKFMLGTAVHYGWIHVNYTSARTLTILSYAYETTAGTPITTGSSGPSRPIANFSASTTGTDIKTTVTFSDLSTYAPTSWKWTFTPATVTFMGGTTDTSQNPQVKFDNDGFYTVKLVVSNALGSDSAERTDYMNIRTAPTAAFSAGTMITNTKTAVIFFDLSTHSPTSWEWTVTPALAAFEGGTSKNSKDPQIRFFATGKFTIKLKVSNGTGSDSVIKTDHILVGETPVVNFVAGATKTDTKTIVNMTDVSTNTPTAWEWTFAPATVTYMGGTSSASQHPQVKFDAAGKYSVTLKATNGFGSELITKTDYIEVVDTPSSIWNHAIEDNAVFVFPNPANKILIVGTPEHTGTINILDLNGKLESSQVINSKKTTVDVMHLPKGNHVIQITTGAGIVNKKIVIE